MLSIIKTKPITNPKSTNPATIKCTIINLL